MILLGSILFTLFYLTLVSAKDVFDSNSETPQTFEEKDSQHRIVLITQDLDTRFWDKVSKGARKQAEEEGVLLEVWGSYGNNQDDFLKKIEVAIHSKVDGIILQGLDREEFKEITKIKASFYGVPIITIANDVPMEESLRKTYVGSNQFMAGQMIANKLVADMGPSGRVILFYDNQHEFYQEERLKGIKKITKDYPNIEVVEAETAQTREQVFATTQNVLNQVPDAAAFIAVNANLAGPMIKEISKRFQVRPLYIYSFDDGPETRSLLMQGKLDGIIEQNPELMGKWSVQRLIEWLNGQTVPLDMDGYFTDIQITEEMNF